jgi:polyhydroxybutyrate depolymerase
LERRKPLISRKVLFVLVALLVALSAVVAVIELWPHATLENTFQFGGLERTYFLHVPPSYDGRTSVPLVIVLHGYTQTPLDIEAMTRFSAKSDKEGFIVAYPQGNGAQWNVGFALFKSNIDDVGFINELISRLEQKYAIDPKRIYVAGFSNGAMMAYLLGADLSDKIAAIAPVSGSIGAVTDNTLEQIPEPSQPVSVIVFHGTMDQSVPYEGGTPYGFLSVAKSVIFWVRHDGCSITSQNETSSDGKVVKSTYTGGINGTEVILYTIVDGTHAWPTTPITATDIIWDFFASHPKQ